ncbi:GTP pyrophosphokinase [Dyadobacter luticola]|uniref:RelA/SpoT protein n=1 Tax=Dyadobacter luticola TaxID=1979387 RepID=A0A5R9KW09_9BACT|nr:RelA/SpoT protein [Dyadobacter luticola]TLV00358.1 RelA/SpoT protein [Dyadobacter luticola]
MDIIDDFIRQYNKEFDYYQKLCQIVASKIEDQLFKRGIKAIVTHRAKKPDRLKDKLLKRNEEKNYGTVEAIYSDIIDLAGIRVSLYFPSEREIIDEVINDLFHVEKTKKFPLTPHIPKHDKRFSGYWATHYRVRLKKENLTLRYIDTIAEIQIASVLMHAWSEVEHDLVYKPFSGKLSKEELAILDEINGLVLSGEIALERLQAAMSERTKKHNEINDKYELTNYLLSNIDKDYLNKIKLGDTYLLNNYLNTIKTLDVSELNSYITMINTDLQESVTDQLLNMLMVEFYDNDKIDLKNYFKNLHVSERKASGFESFVKCWVVLEKAVRDILKDSDSDVRRYMIPNFGLLKDKKILNNKEANELRQLRQIRNYLLHGIETPVDENLKNSYKELKSITYKVVDHVPTADIKEQLKSELDSL